MRVVENYEYTICRRIRVQFPEEGTAGSPPTLESLGCLACLTFHRAVRRVVIMQTVIFRFIMQRIRTSGVARLTPNSGEG